MWSGRTGSTGHGDLLRLIAQCDSLGDARGARGAVDGAGLVEMFCWETEPGYAVHLLNYNNPNAYHGWMQSVTPLGAQRVTMKLPEGVRVKAVELLAAEQTAPFHLEGQMLRFTIPAVRDYEVAAVTVA